MRVLVPTLEFFPILKVGGIADALAAWARELVVLGLEVVVAMPRVEGVDAERVLDSGVRVVGLDAPGFDRGAIYGHDVSDDPTDAAKHAAFTRAVLGVLASAKEAGNPFDVLHVHDWPVALAPYLVARAGRGPSGPFGDVRTVLTVHNAAFQGVFPRDATRVFGLPPFAADDPALAHAGRIALLKAGVVTADAVLTVSPSHADELRAPGGAFGLEDALAARRRPVLGILNGIDLRVWNPADDAALVRTYDATSWRTKAENVAALRREFGLGTGDGRMTVGHVGRLFREKGSDVLADAVALAKARGLPCDVLVAGTGDPDIEARLRSLAGDHGNLRVLGFVDEATVHRILAGSDVVVVPSRLEPCGLVQMYAQRYGTLPVVRNTGGLRDTVVDLVAQPDDGTGFVFHEPRAEALVDTLARALRMRPSPAWEAASVRAMGLDRSWARSAKRVADLYGELGATAPGSL